MDTENGCLGPGDSGEHGTIGIPERLRRKESGIQSTDERKGRLGGYQIIGTTISHEAITGTRHGNDTERSSIGVRDPGEWRNRQTHGRNRGRMAELADATGLSPVGRMVVWVRIPVRPF